MDLPHHLFGIVRGDIRQPRPVLAGRFVELPQVVLERYIIPRHAPRLLVVLPQPLPVLYHEALRIALKLVFPANVDRIVGHVQGEVEHDVLLHISLGVPCYPRLETQYARSGHEGGDVVPDVVPFREAAEDPGLVGSGAEAQRPLGRGQRRRPVTIDHLVLEVRLEVSADVVAGHDHDVGLPPVVVGALDLSGDGHYGRVVRKLVFLPSLVVHRFLAGYGTSPRQPRGMLYEAREAGRKVLVPSHALGLAPHLRRAEHFSLPRLGGTSELGIGLEHVLGVGRLEQHHGAVRERGYHGREEVAVQL
mmetsp:Transcript_25493/g.61289  ORF Transcript_25493/g.61289 Transcript_25493/m.61289 type:complete len:305 (+) Transcript_25493:495-1409(+)